MEKIKRVYYYLFYKIYKSIIYTSEMLGGEFWSDFKAGIVLLTLELWIIGSFLNYYSIINNEKLNIDAISPILLIFLIIFCILNYFSFVHTNIWKEYNREFDKLPKDINKKGGIIVWSIIAFIIINFFVSAFLLQKYVLKMY
ncbi:hypothetical protein [Chryseobacterium sp. 3008163]|uniref:hypothetical protein n=1 Tax=Chryseobacterium sp. 3008163 TaxID=2478663 RepID=UPI000F0D04A7|nr:hypothetical protein [Chryseobacterium sp. 3008163]AYN00140.1 hypothetical protein EAG08_07195 [Chryseobacterium sp. 3008163]